jgi:hypothetical protein
MRCALIRQSSEQNRFCRPRDLRSTVLVHPCLAQTKSEFEIWGADVRFAGSAVKRFMRCFAFLIRADALGIGAAVHSALRTNGPRFSLLRRWPLDSEDDGFAALSC